MSWLTLLNHIFIFLDQYNQFSSVNINPPADMEFTESTLSLIAAILHLCLHVASCQVQYIRPSATAACPEGVQNCITLQHLPNVYTNGSTTLIFLPGNHSLDIELHAVNSVSFSMYSEDISAASIICSNNGFLTFSNVQFIHINNLHFFGCGQGTAYTVDYFSMQECIFRGYHYRGTAFYFRDIQHVNITRSAFLFNTGTFLHPVDELYLPAKHADFEVGGAMAVFRSTVYISDCQFYGNAAEMGAAIFFEQSRAVIGGSTFENNAANYYYYNITVLSGGIITAYVHSDVTIRNSTFFNNSGEINFHGGLVSVLSSVIINNTYFNSSTGSVLFALDSNLTDYLGVYERGSSHNGGVLDAERSNVTLFEGQFLFNDAAFEGGVIYAVDCNVIIERSVLKNNSVRLMGVVTGKYSYLFIHNSTLSYNTARIAWSVISCSSCSVYIQDSTIRRNIAGVMIIFDSNVLLESVSIIENRAKTNRGLLQFTNSVVEGSQGLTISHNSASDATIIYLDRCGCRIFGTFTFSNNRGSFLMINSLVVFKGYTSFLHCSQTADNVARTQRGGAVTNIESTTYFVGKTYFVGNHAVRAGGGIYATGSTLHMRGDVSFLNNTANESGGGLYLYQSKLNCAQNCTLSGNIGRLAGGAIHAISSTVFANDFQKGIWTRSLTAWTQEFMVTDESVWRKTTILFSENTALIGGALAFETNSKLYGNEHHITFERNSATLYGGAVYINDYTSSSMCASESSMARSAATDCFIQELNYNGNKRGNNGFIHYRFVDNYAAKSGASLHGGLLDRCTESTPVDVVSVELSSAVSINRASPVKRSVKEVDIDVAEISSDPVRVCFCVNYIPLCNAKFPTVNVKKGHQFLVTVVAVDQVGRVINATIRSFLSSMAGGLGEGQQAQNSFETCTNLTFNAYSPLSRETLTVYAEGPCNNTGISKRTVSIVFDPCTCAVGFQPVVIGNSRCDCECDSLLRPHITDCNSTTDLLLREGTFWIGFHRQVNNSGFVIYRYCPYDYCHSPTTPVKIDLTREHGADVQCNFNRSELLCGSCKSGFSLSLSSSRCLECPKAWPGLLIAVLLTTILGGFALVAIIQMLNLTVATGMLNGAILYANMIAANLRIFLPTDHSKVISVFIAWLNLDLGIDICLFEGMNSYARQWLQLVFPTYIILLVVLVIFVSERSTWFAKLIGRGNPVATLATLLLLSYTKYLRTVIDIFSFAILVYPDGSSKAVWLPDATLPYFSGRHIPLFLAAVVVLILGSVYTFVIFAWQWLLKLPRKRIFCWIWSTRLNSFIDSYHAPHALKHRYWTGFLLLVRVVLYLVSALNASNDPRITLFAIAVSFLFLVTLKALFQIRVYKKLPVELLNFAHLVNLLLLSLTSLYFLGHEQSQIAVAYTSTSIALALFICIVLYHIVRTFSGRFAKYTKFSCKRQSASNALLNPVDGVQSEQENLPTLTVVEMSAHSTTEYSSDEIFDHDP